MHTFEMYHVISAIRDYATLSVREFEDSSGRDYTEEKDELLKKIELMIEAYKQDALIEQLKVAIKALEK